MVVYFFLILSALVNVILAIACIELMAKRRKIFLDGYMSGYARKIPISASCYGDLYIQLSRYLLLQEEDSTAQKEMEWIKRKYYERGEGSTNETTRRDAGIEGNP